MSTVGGELAQLLDRFTVGISIGSHTFKQVGNDRLVVETDASIPPSELSVGLPVDEGIGEESSIILGSRED
jgi:hypothetical protein